jgi:hypothetical protein
MTEYKELSEAEKAIETLFKVIEDDELFDTNQPSRLSGVMARLSYFNHIIGRYLARLQGAYRAKRASVYNEYMANDVKKVVTHAKQKAEEAALDLESEFDHYKQLHDDTQTFLTICQSHLKVLGIEAKSGF